MHDLNDILDGIIARFQQKYPKRTVTRNWQDRSTYKNCELEPGILTLIYTGEHSIGDVYAVPVNLLVIGRQYCGRQAKGIDVERAELDFLKQWRDFCTSSAAGNLSIQKVLTSQQQEVPDGWFICECTAGPYDLGGEIDWLPTGPEQLPDEILISQAPDIGFGHEPDYFPVTEPDDE